EMAHHADELEVYLQAEWRRLLGHDSDVPYGEFLLVMVQEFAAHTDQFMDKALFTATLCEISFRLNLYGDFHPPPRKTGERTEFRLSVRDEPVAPPGSGEIEDLEQVEEPLEKQVEEFPNRCRAGFEALDFTAIRDE
ncbi:unnamed protein product, partial [Symbiodinium sp. CCMP2456]